MLNKKINLSIENLIEELLEYYTLAEIVKYSKTPLSFVLKNHSEVKSKLKKEHGFNAFNLKNKFSHIHDEYIKNKSENFTNFTSKQKIKKVVLGEKHLKALVDKKDVVKYIFYIHSTNKFHIQAMMQKKISVEYQMKYYTIRGI